MSEFTPRVSPTAFHVMAKPVGPRCNLDCSYCFYLEKEGLYPETRDFRMSDAVLERYIRDYIASQPGTEVSFTWQGGEPTLLGIPYFRRVLELQRRYAGPRVVSNSLQTNGTLLDDEWGAFLRENKFLVGLSIDGPRELHDAYRVHKGGRPSFDKVMAGLESLRRHGVEFNTLTVVSRANMRHGREVYQFLKDCGSSFLQFIPVVERAHPGGAGGGGLSGPPDLLRERGAGEAEVGTVTPWSVEPSAYGEFLVQVFDEWIRTDVGRVFVQLFDVTLGNWVGAGGGLCVFSEQCGGALALEHNGDVYSCDHYVYPRYKLGNLATESLGDMARSAEQRRFGELKSSSLPAYCRRCEVRFACHGECPKHRFAVSPEGEYGLNYLCPAYKRFFHHVGPHMEAMSALLAEGRAPALVMDSLAAARAPTARLRSEG